MVHCKQRANWFITDNVLYTGQDKVDKAFGGTHKWK